VANAPSTDRALRGAAHERTVFVVPKSRPRERGALATVPILCDVPLK